MELIRGIEAVREKHRGAVLTIGNFDGVHMGHQKIIRNVLETASKKGGRTLAMTFDPHPMKVLAPDRGVKLITPLGDKVRLLRHYGIDAVLVIPFSRDFARIEPDDFIEGVIVRKLAARAVVVGHNYSFGKGKSGTTELLRRRGRKFGFQVRVVRQARLDGDIVSSSRVRHLLSWGRVLEAGRYLGRPYSIEGVVVKGAGRGARLLGTPTANLRTEGDVIAKEGVYAVRVSLGGRTLDGVANIGSNPTFENDEMSYEVHLFDFDQDLLGNSLRMFFIDRIREERVFPSAKDLHDQIVQDIASARDILKASGKGLTLM